jgi:hypothetical protein
MKRESAWVGWRRCVFLSPLAATAAWLATAPARAEPPPPKSDDALTPAQVELSRRIRVVQPFAYFSNEALQEYFVQHLKQDTLDRLAASNNAIWVYSEHTRLGNGRLYCFASLGLTEAPAAGRNPRFPAGRYNGLRMVDVKEDQSAEGVRLCRIGALTSATSGMVSDGLEEQLKDIGRTASKGPARPHETADKTEVWLSSSGLKTEAARNEVMNAVPPDAREAFDYRKLQWVAYATAMPMGKQIVCFGFAGVTGRAPPDRMPHVPGTLWTSLWEMKPDESAKSDAVETCNVDVLVRAISDAVASPWDEKGLLENFAPAREDGVPAVRPVPRPVTPPNAPRPFELVMGVATTKDAEATWQRMGGTVTKRAYGDAKRSYVDNDPDGVPNPAVELVDVKGLPLEHLTSARFGFFHGTLYWTKYSFEERADFDKLFLEVTTKYGRPGQQSDGAYEWHFGPVTLTLKNEFIGADWMVFAHEPTFRNVQASHAAVYAAHIKAKAQQQKAF